jgi:hypothetical protein
LLPSLPLSSLFPSLLSFLLPSFLSYRFPSFLPSFLLYSFFRFFLTRIKPTRFTSPAASQRLVVPFQLLKYLTSFDHIQREGYAVGLYPNALLF